MIGMIRRCLGHDRDRSLVARLPCQVSLALVLLLVALACLSALPAASIAEGSVRLHEARFVYQVDYSAVPGWVQTREVTYIIDVGPALGAVAVVQGRPVPCIYKDGRALVTTDASQFELVVSAPARPLQEMGAITLATLREDKAWALSITLDDGYTSQATTAKEFLDRYGYRSTIAVTGSRIGAVFNGHNYASAAELQAVVEDGWHLANHTYSHYYASELGNETNILRDVRLGNESIAAAVPGYKPLLFTSPYTDRGYVATVKSHADELGLWLIQAVGFQAVQADPGSFRYSGQPYDIGRTQILGDGSQFDEVQRWIQENPGQHYWLSLHTHEVVPVCDCLETATDALYRTYGAGGLDNVWVAPAQDVLQYLVTRDKVSVREQSRNLVGQPPPGFQLPVRASPPVLRRAVFQSGREGYDGVRDTFIDSSRPYASYGSDWGLKVRTPDPISVLIRYDLGSLPQGAVVQDAVLRLYQTDESNSNALCISAYPMLRAWTNNATWYSAAQNDPWGGAGASRIGQDRSEMRIGPSAPTPGKDRWFEVGLRDAVQRWVAHPQENQGILLLGGSGGSKSVTLASSNHGNTGLRPMLVVTYTLPANSQPRQGDGILMGRLSLADRGRLPSASWSVPVTLTLYEEGRDTPIWWGSTYSGSYGEFSFSQVPTGSFDLAVDTPGSLRLMLPGLRIHPGPNRFDLDPLTEGDVVHDGYIDIQDWAAVQRALGSAAGLPGYTRAADLNGDERVDEADALILEQAYGLYGHTIQTLPAPPDGAGAMLRLNPVHARITLENSATFDVLLEATDQQVDGVELWLEFDPQLVRVTQVAPTGALPWILEQECDFDGADGVLRFVAGSFDQPMSGIASLLRVTLVGKGMTGPSGTEFSLSRQAEHPNYVTRAGYNVLTNTGSATLFISGPPHKIHLPVILKTLGAERPLASASWPGNAAVALPIVGHVPLRPFPMLTPDAGARDVRVRGGQAYMAVTTYYEDESRFLYRLKIDPPTDPRLESVSNGNGMSRDPDEVWLEGDRAYVAKKTRGVDIFDISVPAEMRYLGSYYAQGPVAPIAKGIHVVGDRLYVADEAYGLQIVDVRNPASPTLLGQAGQIFGEGVWCDGTVAYVAADYPGVFVIDVSDPRRPSRLIPEALRIPGDPPGRAVDVQVQDGLLYVAAENRGIAVFDVSRPQSAVLLGTLGTVFAQKIDVVGHIVYVADDTGGLLVVDASDPANMRVVGQCNTLGRAFGVTAVGRYAYVADGKEGLQVIDLAPLTPTATATATPTASETPSPTATPRHARVMLPVFLRHGLDDLARSVD